MRIAYRAALTLVALALAGLAAPISAQKIDDATRNRNREQVEGVLRSAGPANNLDFSPARNNRNNFSANLTKGLRWSESVEVVIFVTDSDTIVLRGYPKRKGQYINIDKAKDPELLMRKLLSLGVRTFFHWGVDEDGDAYFGYAFTLESGFPAEAIRIVLGSIANHDQYVGELVTALE
jgi:hypothetical protein